MRTTAGQEVTRLAHTPFCLVRVVWSRGRVARVVLRAKPKSARLDPKLGPRLLSVLRGEGTPRVLRMDASGLSTFARKVIGLCARIRPGRVMTYAELAKAAGRPNAARAVGQVMARNPFPLLVPCHRVVGVDGRLVGFGGGRLMKEALLSAEGWSFAGRGRNRRVVLKNSRVR
ncbi:MAG: MGMT family protein [candidate division WOR-3 bacterium]